MFYSSGISPNNNLDNTSGYLPPSTSASPTARSTSCSSSRIPSAAQFPFKYSIFFVPGMGITSGPFSKQPGEGQLARGASIAGGHLRELIRRVGGLGKCSSENRGAILRRQENLLPFPREGKLGANQILIIAVHVSRIPEPLTEFVRMVEQRETLVVGGNSAVEAGESHSVKSKS